MKRGIILFAALWVGLFSVAGSAAGHKPTEISIGYVTQWPSPAQFAQDTKTFDFALGVSVNWVPFDNGNAMSTALAEVQIAYSQGHVPFLVGITEGLDLTMVGIAGVYPENDNCIVPDNVGITRDNAALLAGSKVAVSPGSLSHYRMLRVLEHLGIDESQVEIVATDDGTATASALQRGEVVMACASGGVLRAIRTLGKPLLSGAEQEALGLRLFDAITVSTAFMNEHPEMVQAFMDVVGAANEQWQLNPDPMRAAIARAAQMDQGVADRALSEFSFLSIEQQKSEAWMGAEVGDYISDLADFLATHGQLGEPLENYDRFVTTRFLR
jgi:taurine transport system substrate-binding protein